MNIICEVYQVMLIKKIFLYSWVGLGCLFGATSGDGAPPKIPPRLFEEMQQIYSQIEESSDPADNFIKRVLQTFLALHPKGLFLENVELIKLFRQSLKMPIENGHEFNNLSKIIKVLRYVHKSSNICLTRLKGIDEKNRSDQQNELLEQIELLEDTIFSTFSFCNFEKCINNASCLDEGAVVEFASKPFGWRGVNALNGLDQAVRSVIHSLVGRIFAIESTIGAFGETHNIVWTGSGMVLPKEAGVGEVLHYDEIVTCRHVMSSHDPHQHLSFYFVRGDALNPETGWPENCDTEESCSHYLIKSATEGNSVRQILIQKPEEDKAHTGMEPIPEDAVLVCRLNQPFNSIRVPQGIQFQKMTDKNVREKLLRARGVPYYALGYPTLRYLTKRDMPDFLQLAGVAPLTVTSALEASDIKAPPHTLEHNAPTPQGMSGGPVVIFDEAQQVILIGVVGRGEVDVAADKEKKLFFTFPE